MGSDALLRVEAAYQETDRISQLAVPYIFGGGHNAAFAADPGYDCSGFVSHIFHHVGILGIPHVAFPMDTRALAGWGNFGRGKYLTMWVVNSGTQEHCFLDFHLFNTHNYPFRFAQAAHPGTTVGWLAADTTGFTPRHWTGT